MFSCSGNHGDREGGPLCSSKQIERGIREQRRQASCGTERVLCCPRGASRALHPHRRGPREPRHPLLSRTRTAFLLAPRPEPLAHFPPRGDAREQLSKKEINKRDSERQSARAAEDSGGSSLSHREPPAPSTAHTRVPAWPGRLQPTPRAYEDTLRCCSLAFGEGPHLASHLPASSEASSDPSGAVTPSSPSAPLTGRLSFPVCASRAQVTFGFLLNVLFAPLCSRRSEGWDHIAFSFVPFSQSSTHGPTNQSVTKLLLSIPWA